MDTKHLKTFITFSEEKSYLKASYKLNYAPSTLAEHISSLENELNIKLVESQGKKTILTKAGEKFLLYAQKIMNIYKTACQDMISLNTVKGNLRIMTVESLGLYSMADVFTKFMIKYSDVTLSISIGNSNTAIEKLKKDEIDVAYLYALTPVSLPEIESTVLFKEPLYFVTSPKHVLAQKKLVTPKDFACQTLIQAQKDCYYSKRFEEMLNSNHVKLKGKIELDSGNLIKKYVCSGLGFTILPYSVIRNEIQNNELTILNWLEEDWEAYAQILTLKKEWVMPAVTALIKISQDTK